MTINKQQRRRKFLYFDLKISIVWFEKMKEKDVDLKLN